MFRADYEIMTSHSSTSQSSIYIHSH